MSTEEEKEIIDQRLKAYHQNPKLGSSWQDVYKRIINKYGSAKYVMLKANVVFSN
ncbi:MAG: addiction module protein [bacterium]